MKCTLAEGCLWILTLLFSRSTLAPASSRMCAASTLPASTAQCRGEFLFTLSTAFTEALHFIRKFVGSGLCFNKPQQRRVRRERTGQETDIISQARSDILNDMFWVEVLKLTLAKYQISVKDKHENTKKIIILWNIMTNNTDNIKLFSISVFIVKLNVFLWGQSWIFSIITAVFSTVTWSFRNHTNMLILVLKKHFWLIIINVETISENVTQLLSKILW